MNSTPSDKSPLSVRILQLSSIIVTLSWIIITITQWNNRIYVFGTQIRPAYLIFLYAVFAAVATIGILTLKKWAWSLFFGLNLFSFIATANLLLTPRIANGKTILFFASLISLFFIFILNFSNVHSTYKTNIIREQKVPAQLTTFSVICITAGVFIFFELFTGFRIAPGTVIVKLFVSAVGLVFIILGIGIAKLNSLALQTIEPALILTLFSFSIIFIKDYLDGTRAFLLTKSIFYIVFVAAMTIFWITKMRSKLGNLTVHQN